MQVWIAQTYEYAVRNASVVLWLAAWTIKPGNTANKPQAERKGCSALSAAGMPEPG